MVVLLVVVYSVSPIFTPQLHGLETVVHVIWPIASPRQDNDGVVLCVSCEEKGLVVVALLFRVSHLSSLLSSMFFFFYNNTCHPANSILSLTGEATSLLEVKFPYGGV